MIDIDLKNFGSRDKLDRVLNRILKIIKSKDSNMIRNWLYICRNLRQLYFNPNYIIKHNINAAQKNIYLPISLDKPKIKN